MRSSNLIPVRRTINKNLYGKFINNPSPNIVSVMDSETTEKILTSQLNFAVNEIAE